MKLSGPPRGLRVNYTVDWIWIFALGFPQIVLGGRYLMPQSCMRSEANTIVWSGNRPECGLKCLHAAITPDFSSELVRIWDDDEANGKG